MSKCRPSLRKILAKLWRKRVSKDMFRQKRSIDYDVFAYIVFMVALLEIHHHANCFIVIFVVETLRPN